jgi:hypothetical protein
MNSERIARILNRYAAKRIGSGYIRMTVNFIDENDEEQERDVEVEYDFEAPERSTGWPGYFDILEVTDIETNEDLKRYFKDPKKMDKLIDQVIKELKDNY